MAKRYHQSKKDRRDESRGMKRAMDEDHPSKHMGHGEFANMPRREIMHPYPKEKYGYSDYDDTVVGIDEVDTESANKVNSHKSKQK